MTNKLRLSIFLCLIALVGACGGSGYAPLAVPAPFEPNFASLASQVNADPESGGRSFCCAGDRIYVVWNDNRNGQQDVFFNYSTDGGKTWEDEDIQIEDSTENSSQAVVCCDGLRVYVAWKEEVFDGGGILLNRSTDGGKSWANEPTRVSSADHPVSGDYTGFDPRICCSGQRVYVAWVDSRDRPPGLNHDDIYFDYSSNGGASFHNEDKRLDTDDPGNADSGGLRLCCDGLYVYAAWADLRNGLSDPYLNSSSNGGVSWQQSDERLNRGELPGEHTSGAPALCCEGQRVFAAWENYRNGNSDIVGNYSTNAGQSFGLPAVEIVVGDSDAYDPAVCCSDGRVYMAWVDNRDGAFDIYFNYSENSGQTWWGFNESRLDVGDDVGESNSEEVTLCCSGLNVYAAWEDSRDGNTDIYFNWSLDGGASWAPLDLRLDLGDDPGEFASYGPRICCEGDAVYLVWGDERTGTPNTWFNASLPQP